MNKFGKVEDREVEQKETAMNTLNELEKKIDEAKIQQSDIYIETPGTTGRVGDTVKKDMQLDLMKHDDRNEENKVMEDIYPLAIHDENKMACSNKENVVLDKDDLEDIIDKLGVEDNLCPK